MLLSLYFDVFVINNNNSILSQNYWLVVVQVLPHVVGEPPCYDRCYCHFFTFFEVMFCQKNNCCYVWQILLPLWLMLLPLTDCHYVGWCYCQCDGWCYCQCIMADVIAICGWCYCHLLTVIMLADVIGVLCPSVQDLGLLSDESGAICSQERWWPRTEGHTVPLGHQRIS